jgi:hypothetical protein
MVIVLHLLAVLGVIAVNAYAVGEKSEVVKCRKERLSVRNSMHS